MRLTPSMRIALAMLKTGRCYLWGRATWQDKAYGGGIVNWGTGRALERRGLATIHRPRDPKDYRYDLIPTAKGREFKP